ncbi:PglL family O-oligosaccharyltransferase [Pseudorhodoferax sp.]|uniref:PglL family O-oligosaccharyltransferase n=1 Tax=Pseudorhodoferax sp. TaxID=1993553 RepID=UPI002DD690A0|nr:Wzy polymerase domain-containing protein [Pseudorhodoferax sp.]
MIPQRATASAASAGELLRTNLAASVLVLCTLPWLNPLSFGPVASVPPWLFSAFAAALALLAATPLAQPRPQTLGLWWCLCGASTLLVLALWPRDALLPAYEALALAGAFLLVGLGAALARCLPSATPIGGLPWALWCALLPWILAGLVSSAVALAQYFGQAGPLAPWVNWAPPGEAFANLRQRNQFASLTSMALAALLARWVLVPGHLTRRHGAWLAAAVVLLVAGNAATASRTGLLQLLLLAGVALLWRRDGRTLAWVGGMLGGYALAVLLLPWAAGLDPDSHGMFARLREGDALCSSRLTLWRNVLQLIAAHPWLGWGWGELDYAHYMTLYDGPRFCDILDNAHSLPLHLAVELGVPAAVLVCAGVLAWVLRARPWRESDAARRAAWLVLAVLGVHSLLEYPLWYGPFQLALGLCLGLLWHEPAAEGPAPAVVRRVPPLLAALALGLAAYASWDYWRIGQIYRPPALRAPEYRDDTLAKLQRSWLFQRQVRFAALSVAELTPDNAAFMHALATELLHFSPEPRVIEMLLNSAQLLGLQDEVQFHAPRFEAAFPKDHARWLADQPAR